MFTAFLKLCVCSWHLLGIIWKRRKQIWDGACQIFRMLNDCPGMTQSLDQHTCILIFRGFTYLFLYLIFVLTFLFIHFFSMVFCFAPLNSVPCLTFALLILVVSFWYLVLRIVELCNIYFYCYFIALVIIFSLYLLL